MQDLSLEELAEDLLYQAITEHSKEKRREYTEMVKLIEKGESDETKTRNQK